MENLADSAEGFRFGAKRVRNQMWFKDMKIRVCLCSGVIIILLVAVITSSEYIAIENYLRIK